MNKKLFLVTVIMMMLAGTTAVFSQETLSASDSQEQTQVVQTQDNSKSVKYLSAAIAVAFGCIAGAMAVGKIGAAAMGALSENPEVSGKALPFVGLAEGICLWGFIIAFMIIMF